MKALERIQNYIANLDQKNLYKLIAITIGSLIIVVGLLVFRYYRRVNYLVGEINTINEQRELVKRIMIQADRVKKQRAEVDTMIAEDEGFKIGGYFNSILSKLHLIDRKTVDETAYIDHEGKYRESILKAKLIDMTMKDVCELLNELDQKKRIYTKELELVAVTKTARPTLEVSLTIGTLEPKPVTKE